MTLQNTFIDQTKIFIKAGDGGSGCVSFRREKFIPFGGPDGGNGGSGGSIILRGTRHRSTLNHFKKKHHFKADRGQSGQGNQRTGADGDPLIIEVPLGTVAYNAETNTTLGEVLEHDQELVLQEGGRGGIGNYYFRSSTNQAPRKSTPGQVRDGFWVKLELKLIADVGIVGLPNAGKSTLLSCLTAAKSKIADYPFTTLFPYLGVLDHQEQRLVLADMPGLIEGAHEGSGLGTRFLRHIERTRLLLYLVAASPEDEDQSFKDFLTCQKEVHYYNRELIDRPFMVAINKSDLIAEEDSQNYAQPFFKKGIDPVFISAKLGSGLNELLNRLHEKI
ncbi:MAG: GTPase ObgE [Bdellovibrionales bacterium]|nr:GTPase ObgE [Bdellovibrionales bacterium]